MALVDTACAKTVAGFDFAKQLGDLAKQQGFALERVDEAEPFRFGPGKRILSSGALLVLVCMQGRTIILRVSIIDKPVPCLISRPVLKRLGCVIDLDNDTLSSKRLATQVCLRSVAGGHVAIELNSSMAQPTEAALERCRNGQEVAVCDEAIEKALPKAVFSVQSVYKIEYDSSEGENQAEPGPLEPGRLVSSFPTRVSSASNLNPHVSGGLEGSPK